MLNLQVKVIPSSSSCRFRLDESLGILKCFVTSPALEGKANKMLLKNLSKILKLPQSLIKIKSGMNSRVKSIVIDTDITMDELLGILLS